MQIPSLSRALALGALGVLAVFASTPIDAIADGVGAPGDAVEATPAPFLWMIDRDPPAFLYGTIHLPDERVLQLPLVVEAAFETSDAVYTEIPMTPEAMLSALEAAQLPGDQTLADVVPEALLDRCEAYLSARGLPLSLFARFKVAFFAAQLSLLDELQKLAAHQPQDGMLHARAIELGKDVRALETIEEQTEVFDALDEDDSAAMLELTLDYLEELAAKGESPTAELIRLYLAGDADALVAKMYEYFDPDDPFTQKFVDQAITLRNERMAARIEDWLSGEPDRSHFFAVGALHYPMEIGLLALLREGGHEIVRLTPSDEARVRDMRAAATR